MDDAVRRYRARRQARLDARGIRRMDDDESTNGNTPPARRGGGHGNSRIPFGLCQREGIKIDPSWSPRDAWDALAGKGYSAGEVYSELRKTGKVSRKTGKTKKPPTKIEEKHFPAGMVSKNMRKNTMFFADFVSKHCDDGSITSFLSMGTGTGANVMGEVKCKRSTTGEAAQVAATLNRDSREIMGVEVMIPMFSSIKDEQQRKQAVMTFCHEWTHYLDLSAREGKQYRHFTEDDKELQAAIKADGYSEIGKEAKDLFDKFNAEYDRLRQEENDRAALLPTAIARAYGDKRPDWLSEDGRFIFYGTSFFADRAGVNRFKKILKESEKDLHVEYQRKRRSFMDGVSCLEGIYDSLNSGTLRGKKVTRYGHSPKYFQNDGNRGVEMIADYVALKAINPSLAAVFERDKPEIARALDNTIERMTKKLGGGV